MSSYLTQYDPKEHIAPPPPPSENNPFWYLCGLILLLLIINDICHILTGQGLWFHL